MSTDLKELAKKKKIEELQKAAYARKINTQYKILEKWDKGEITGIECIEAIEEEGKIFRIENDLKALRTASNVIPMITPPGV